MASQQEVTELRNNNLGPIMPQRVLRKTRNANGDELVSVDQHQEQQNVIPQRRRLQHQHPAELPRNIPQVHSNARRQYESRNLPAEPLLPMLPRETQNNQNGHTETEPEDFYRTAPTPAPMQRQRAHTRELSHDGRESAQSRRTSTQSGTDKTHRRQPSQPSDERLAILATPKHITPKKNAVPKPPRTEREILRAERKRMVTRERGVELPFNDKWTNSKVERQGVRGSQGHGGRPGYPGYPNHPSHPNHPEHPDHPNHPNNPNHLSHPSQPGNAGHQRYPNHPESLSDFGISGGPGPAEMDVERMEHMRMEHIRMEQMGQPAINTYDPFSAVASMFGFDNRRQHAMEHEIMALRKRLLHSQKKNEELNYNLSELSRANDGLQGDLRKVQQKTFNQMTKSAWTPLEDRAIQELLQEIHQEIEVWAEDNCIESFDEIKGRLSEAQQAELLELCRQVVDVSQGDLASQFQWWEERRVDPILLLTALMTRRMYSCVFTNEFLALGALDQGSMGPVLDIYRKLIELDFKQAQVWRSQLMRIIVGTPQSGGRFNGLSSKLDVSGWIKRYCDDALDECGQCPEAAFLKSELSAESRESLLSCWTRAAELFIQLQTQVAILQWRAPDLLRSTVNPLKVESHRSQAFPKGRNDGKPISLVISPMVTFHGNEDGERYDDWRAVCKATVLVIDEEVESEEEEDEESVGESEEETSDSGDNGDSGDSESNEDEKKELQDEAEEIQ